MRDVVSPEPAKMLHFVGQSMRYDIMPSAPRVGQLRTIRDKFTYPIVGVLSIIIIMGSVYLGIPIDAVTIIIVSLIGVACAIVFMDPSRALIFFIMFLPIHSLVCGDLLMHSNCHAALVVLQVWKELLLMVAIFSAATRSLMKGPTVQLRLVDILVAVYLALNIISTFVFSGTPLVGRLFGLRANVTFILVYILGRLVPLSLSRQRLAIRLLLLIGLASGAFALIERFVLPVDWPTRVGVIDYAIHTMGAGKKGALGWHGLTWTYWTSTGIARMGSFFSGPLDFAASILITGAVALICAVFPEGLKLKKLARLTVVSVSVGLILAISRAAAVSFLIEMAIIGRLVRSRRIYVGALLLVGVIGLVGIIGGGAAFTRFANTTLAFTNPSSKGHLQQWEESLASIVSRPFGLGEGTSGFVGARLGDQTGGENEFLSLGVELGVAGMLLYLFIQVSCIYTGLKIYRRLAGENRIIVLAFLVSRVGIILLGLTTSVEVYIFDSYVSWWFAGYVVQLETVLSKKRILRPYGVVRKGREGTNLAEPRLGLV